MGRVHGGSRPETPQGNTQAGLTMGVVEWYDHLMVDLRDPRVDDWLGMASIWPTIIICSAYVYFVKVVGPRLMKDREPYELKNILWWKKYLTTIQLVQFVLVFFHALQPLIFTCDYPVAASLMFAVTGVQYFILFMAFYRQAYSKKKSVVKVDKNGNSDLSLGNGQLANGHTSILANGGETDIRQRKLA